MICIALGRSLSKIIADYTMTALLETHKEKGYF